MGEWNTINHCDCVEGMNALPSGCVDLAFADPPFNIGYEYDVYDDKVERQKYLDWSRVWISAVHRVLKNTGTFWLAIGDEFAAELKLISQDIGFHCRSWVIWYYTFGVNCSQKFSRSHAHLFYFVKDANSYTFRADEIRVPSARQLVYNDKRANALGRLPDDTWILRSADAEGNLSSNEEDWLADFGRHSPDDMNTWTLRPQDLAGCFTSNEDTWYFPRVAGTFKERAGFHGCQMPEQLLGRIIKACSNEQELVIDPFSGSATTLAVAKKLGRRFVGFELSNEYVLHGLRRLDEVRVGDVLEGSPEPLVSAPKTQGRKRSVKTRSGSSRSSRTAANSFSMTTDEERNRARLIELTNAGVIDAFRATHEGYSSDRIVADPVLNERFVDACREQGLVGDALAWNSLLFRARKSGRLADIRTTRRTSFTWNECDDFLFASEIALRMMLDDGADSLDAILCDPKCASEFDEKAEKLARGWSPLQYRWAALKLRKRAKVARMRAAVLTTPSRFGRFIELDAFKSRRFPEEPGVYLISDESSAKLYVGECLNLRSRLNTQFGRIQNRRAWAKLSATRIQTVVTRIDPGDILAYQSRLAQKYKPKHNFPELWTAT